jgi:hypothetical protein
MGVAPTAGQDGKCYVKVVRDVACVVAQVKMSKTNKRRKRDKQSNLVDKY